MKEFFEKFLVDLGVKLADLTIDEIIKLEGEFKTFLDNLEKKFNEAKNKNSK